MSQHRINRRNAPDGHDRFWSVVACVVLRKWGKAFPDHGGFKARVTPESLSGLHVDHGATSLQAPRDHQEIMHNAYLTCNPFPDTRCTPSKVNGLGSSLACRPSDALRIIQKYMRFIRESSGGEEGSGQSCSSSSYLTTANQSHRASQSISFICCLCGPVGRRSWI